MTGTNKEKIYHGISLFCIVLCVWLIGQVAADELFGRGQETIVHQPPDIIQTERRKREGSTSAGLWMTEDQISAELNKYIPQELPLEGLAVRIAADGTLALSGTVPKQKLLAYFEQMQTEVPGGSLLTVLAPKTIDFALSVCCTMDDENGLMALTPGSVTLAGNTIDADAMPCSFWDGLSQGVNKLLLYGGEGFRRITFSDGALYIE